MKIKQFSILLLMALIIISTFGVVFYLKHNPSLGQAPILHEGRIKPLDSVARIELQKTAHSDKTSNQNAIAWLEEALFDPMQASQKPVFKIDNLAVKDQLHLNNVSKSFFSLQELAPGLVATRKQALALASKAPEDLLPEQEKFLDVHKSAENYTQILNSLGALLPLESSMRNNEKEISPSDKSQTSIRKQIAEIIRKKGFNVKSYNAREARLMLFGKQIMVMELEAKKNNFFRIVPYKDTYRDMWMTPWEALHDQMDTGWNRQYLLDWQNAVLAYRHKNEKASHESIKKIIEDFYQNRSDSVSHAKIIAEIAYNILKPFFWAQVLYCLALLVQAISRKSGAFFVTVLLISGGMMLHAIGIAMRIYILARPPVSTLYETLIFASFFTILAAAIFEYHRSNKIALLSGCFLSGLLLFLAPSFAPQGDTLQMLVAVLNTNFWLATHVICVTAGYGFCVFTSLIAHITLYRQLVSGNTPEKKKVAEIQKMLLVSLFLMGTGTLLGGIWADQSWGRFWGWDPKENGALLVVLWITWILHGWFGKYFNTQSYLASTALLAVVVALSWFGVNLLGVGFHSYGFTSNIAVALGIFCLFEILAVGFAWRKISKHKLPTSVNNIRL